MHLNIPTDIPLADPYYHTPAPIDMILGADVFWNLLGSERIVLGNHQPILFETRLGWVVSGPINTGLANKFNQPVKCNIVAIANCNVSCEFSSRFCEVFKEGLGRFTGGPVGFQLRDGARPVFMRARPLAYALREPIERALDQMVRDGILTPVATSDWATPIVPVMKKDGTVRRGLRHLKRYRNHGLILLNHEPFIPSLNKELENPMPLANEEINGVEQSVAHDATESGVRESETVQDIIENPTVENQRELKYDENPVALPVNRSRRIRKPSGGSGIVTKYNTNDKSSPLDDLQTQLTRFWQIEEISHHESSTYSAEEALCEEHFVKNTTRLENGRFCVTIPLKESSDTLSDSFHRAKRCFLAIERRNRKNPSLDKMYKDFMSEYISLGHMSQCQVEEDNVSYFIPHHGVLRESSTTTKLRVVFNASAPTTSGISLNQIQMVGPTVQDDLTSILLRFRMYKYVLSADVEKMYRQMSIHH
ncbi:uncharacterized protein LOC119190433 [Manduca sexta]|uniref:uncharacterized protein LOC119190433 n=1 Tax=Manduca sexta TaxID=7130 RepID=UPI00188F4672|nr:uncharacterized protein LOC119190433 [Manduca sexta]